MTDRSPTEAPAVPEDHHRDIARLEHHVREMADLALGMVADGTRAFLQADAELSRSVTTRAAPLDRYDLNIETEAVRLVAMLQPEGRDLRAIEAVIKIANCVDRVGRLGFDVARSLSSVALPSDEPRQLLARMDAEARAMVEEALSAFLAADANRAKAVFARDDAVDALHRQVQKVCIDQLRSGGAAADRLVFTVLAARHLERVADNACKIAEKAIYAITGERRSEYLPLIAHLRSGAEGGR